MYKFPLVSIIIPTYNRADLIGETLNSIASQIYSNWECLVVDDGSTDATEDLLKTFIKKDKRFQYYKRTESKPKGANTCRNIGLEIAKGDYIVFFDSDDLMTPNHLEVKVDCLLQNQCDYVITKTEYFNYPEGNVFLEENYNFNSKDITAYNYISHHVNWLTLDVCIAAPIAKTILFNEELKAGQEYNYFSKLLLTTTNAVFLKKVVSLRRHQENSIRGNLRENRIATYLSYYNTYWNTYLDIRVKASDDIRKYLLFKCASFAYKLGNSHMPNSQYLYKALYKELRLKGLFHIFRLYLGLHKKQKV